MCSPKVKLHSADLPYSALFNPENTFTFVECEVFGQNYYITKNYVQNSTIIYDFGCQIDVTELKIRPTSNSYIKDR